MRRAAAALIAVLALGAVAQAGPGFAVRLGRVLGRALHEHGAQRVATRLADEVGARLAGGPEAARAVDWAVAEMKALRLSNVHVEPVTVEAWARGADDRVELVAPYPHRLRALALGNSVGTPPAGIAADVVEVDSFDALRKVDARGKIVFFDAEMRRSPGFEEYGRVGLLRFRGASEAARAGAVAAVIRSAGTGAHRLPHTGATLYDPAVAKIPFVALAAEDAMLLHRALARGSARLALHLSCGPRPDVASANVIGEVPGSRWPDQIVLLGAHLDSWDVGDGALDDGAGVGIVLDAARLIATLSPRRTVRVVLFMNEEHGLSGARAYAAAHQAELARHVAAMEADAGAGAPLGLGVSGGDAARALIARLAQPAVPEIPPLGGAIATGREGGSDLGPLHAAGVPVVTVRQDASDYFEWHHTDGDTADKIDPDGIARTAAAFAVLAGQLADIDETLPRDPPAK